MARINKELQVLNINISLSLGEGRNYWADPNVTRYENLEIPLRMFSAKALADLIADMVSDMPEELKEEVAHFDAERKAKEDTEKQDAIDELVKNAQEAGVAID